MTNGRTRLNVNGRHRGYPGIEIRKYLGERSQSGDALQGLRSNR